MRNINYSIDEKLTMVNNNCQKKKKTFRETRTNQIN